MDEPAYPAPQSPPSAQPIPPLPRVWIGYLLGAATVTAQFVAVEGHPELAKELGIPPLYLFLAAFVGFVYWLVCVHRIFAVLDHVPQWNHAISPARAVGFHFIPIYNLYWCFRWPREIAEFVNAQVGGPMMKPAAVGAAVLLAFLLRILDPGLGLILSFLPISYLARGVRQALAEPQNPGE